MGVMFKLFVCMSLWRPLVSLPRAVSGQARFRAQNTSCPSVSAEHFPHEPWGEGSWQIERRVDIDDRNVRRLVGRVPNISSHTGMVVVRALWFSSRAGGEQVVLMSITYERICAGRSRCPNDTNANHGNSTSVPPEQVNGFN